MARHPSGLSVSSPTDCFQEKNARKNYIEVQSGAGHMILLKHDISGTS